MVRTRGRLPPRTPFLLKRFSKKLVCQRVIDLGVMALIVFTPLHYGSVRLWTFTLVELFIVFLLFLWVLEMFFGRKVMLVRTPLDIPILLFCGYSVVSSLLFSHYEYASQLALHQILTFAALFFIVVNHLRTQRQLALLVFTIVANGLLHAGLHLVRSAAGLSESRVWGLSLDIGNHSAGYLLTIIPICIALSFVALSRKQRILYLIASVVMSAAMFFSLVAGAMLSFTLSLICVALLFGGTEPLRRKVAILSGVIVLLLLILCWVGIEPVFKELLTVTNWRNGSAASRISLWKSAVSIFTDHPITGTGLGTFNYIYPVYRLPDMPGMAVYAHSDWLQLLAEQGLVAFVLALAGAGVFLWMVIKKIRKHSHLGSPSARKRTPSFSSHSATREHGSSRSKCTGGPSGERAYVSGSSHSATRDGLIVGGTVGCVACSANVVVDFNLHIPAIALLFVTILAITTVAASSRFSTRTGLIRLRQYEFSLSGYLRAVVCVGAILFWGFSSMVLTKPILAERLYSKGSDLERLLLWNKAIKQYERAVQCIPKNADYYRILGKAYARQAVFSQDKLEWLSKAEEAYKQAIRLCPMAGDHYAALAEFYDVYHHSEDLGSPSTRKEEEAEAAYTEAIALDPNNAFYHRILGDHYLKQGKMHRAAEEYKLSIQLYPQDLALILNRVHKLVLRAQSPSSLKSQVSNLTKVDVSYFLSIVQAIASESPTAHVTCADFLVRKGFIEAALAHYQSALALEPDNIKLHAHLALVYAKLKRFEEATQEYLNAARLDDSNPSYLLAVGRIYMSQGREKDAVELWESVIRKHPQNPEAHYRLGLFHEQRNLGIAWEHLRKAISADPKNIGYRSRLAQSYYERELYYQATCQWEEILRLQPDDVVTRTKLARVYRQINRQDKAREYYSSVLEIQPRNAEALAAMGTSFLEKSLSKKGF